MGGAVTFAELCAAARAIDRRATVEVTSHYYSHRDDYAVDFGIYTEQHGWYKAESPEAALMLFDLAVKGSAPAATHESVGEVSP